MGRDAQPGAAQRSLPARQDLEEDAEDGTPAHLLSRAPSIPGPSQERGFCRGSLELHCFSARLQPAGAREESCRPLLLGFIGMTVGVSAVRREGGETKRLLIASQGQGCRTQGVPLPSALRL